MEICQGWQTNFPEYSLQAADRGIGMQRSALVCLYILQPRNPYLSHSSAVFNSGNALQYPFSLNQYTASAMAAAAGLGR